MEAAERPTDQRTMESSSEHSVRLPVEHDFHQPASHGKVHPAPCTIEAHAPKRSCVCGDLTGVLERVVRPFRTGTRRGLVVDDHPTGVGLEEEVDPSMEDLATVLDELHGMLDQHPAGGEPVVHDRHEAPRTPDGIFRCHGALPGCAANETCRAVDCVVAIGVHELGGNDRVQRGADPSHVLALDGDARAHLDDGADDRAFHRLRPGRGDAFANGRPGRHPFNEPLNPSLKTWSGRQTAWTVHRSLAEAAGGSATGEWLTFTAPARGRLGLDPGGTWDTQGLGFSLNEHPELRMCCRPFVEPLVSTGLQAFPLRRSGGGYRYHVWRPAALPAAVAAFGSRRDIVHSFGGFEAKTNRNGRNKVFRRARPLPDSVTGRGRRERRNGP